jgi:hypothetical protein
VNTLRTFGTPWGTPLKLVTGLTTGLLMVVMLLGLALPSVAPLHRVLMVTIPPFSIALGALFAIRGLELTADSILVLRPGWNARIRLAGLQSVTVDAQATRRSFRSCGNGGFFSITGWHYNRKLGNYRLFGTDLKRAVVLHFPRRRVVVTPEDPEAFARCVRELAGLPKNVSTAD